MATSGSVDFTLTAREVINYALKKLRVLGAGEAADSDQAEDAMRELNLMLKGWQKHESMWRLTEGTVSLVADDIDYTLSPAPHRIVDVRYYNGSTYTPLTMLERDRYYALPNRTTAGTPTQVYVDYQRTGATMYVWQPLATVGTETITYTYQRAFEDVDSLDNDLDVRQSWLEVVGYNLAERLIPDYGRTGELAARITAKADKILQDALDDDRPDEIRFEPERAWGGW